MIPKKHRGISQKESENLFKTARRIPIQKGFLAMKQTTRAEARVVVSVSKKAAKSAVKRTFIRRRIQAVLAPVLKELQPVDMLIVWTGAEPPDAQQLEKELTDAFLKTKLLS